MPFIVLEGLDGAGKSTQLALIKELLNKRGEECEYLHFPRFDSPIYGDLIAKFLRGDLGSLDQVNPYLVALLFAGDRADAAKQIREWLDSGKSILLDRYVYSNIGYQCAKLEGIAEQDTLRDWILDTEYTQFAIPKPDISIFLDVPFEFTAAKLAEERSGDDRAYLNGKRDIHEDSLELQRSVREIYLRSSEIDDKLKVVNCGTDDNQMASPQVIFSRIESVLNSMNIIF